MSPRRNLTLLFTILVFPFFLTGCGDSSPKTPNWTLDAYLKAGFPSPEKPWSATEMDAAAKALTQIAKTNPHELPRYKGERSGELFARITSQENLDFLKNKNIPVDQRILQASDFLGSGNEILKVYLDHFASKTLSDREFVEILGMQFRTTNVVLHLINEFVPTLNKADSTYLTRMAGLEKARLGMIGIILNGFQTLSKRSNYQPQSVNKLILYMQQTFPEIMVEVAPERCDQLLGRLDTLIKDPSLNDLRPGLVKLNDLINDAVAKDGSSPRDRVRMTVDDFKRPGLKMHRLQAGVPDDDGWCLAESTLGGFTVQVPGRYNDYTLISKATDGVATTIHGVGMASLEGVKHTAALFSRADGKYKDDFFADMTSKYEKYKGIRLEQKQVVMAGRKGTEIKLSGEKTALFRAFITERGVIQLVVDCSLPIAADKVAKDAQRFFDTFSLAEEK